MNEQELSEKRNIILNLSIEEFTEHMRMNGVNDIIKRDVGYLLEARDTLVEYAMQQDNDWLAMLKAICLLSDAMKFGDGDWRLSDDETIFEQFDPWDILRKTTKLVAEWNGVDLDTEDAAHTQATH